jgi:hypothetical protein
LDNQAVQRIGEQCNRSKERMTMAGTGYLSADELAELIDCRPNQRSKMISWLTTNRWRFEVASSGLPRVARAYHDRKMGITEEKSQAKYAETPNLSAFT